MTIRDFDICENGQTIGCRMYGAAAEETPAVIVLFIHGFAGHRGNSAAAAFAQALTDSRGDAAVFCFDLPCHGDDKGERLSLDLCGDYLDGVTAYIRRKYPSARLFANATSFGAYLLLKYISEKGSPFVKTVLRCPAVNMYEVLTQKIMSERQLRTAEKGGLPSVGFDRKIKVSGGFLRELKAADIRERAFGEYAGDILVIQGTADELVRHGEVKSFCGKNHFRFLSADGCDHRFRTPGAMEYAIREGLAFCGL